MGCPSLQSANVNASRGRFVLELEHQDLLATQHLNEEPQQGPQDTAITISEGLYAYGFIVIAHGEPAFNGLHGDLEEDRKWYWL